MFLNQLVLVPCVSYIGPGAGFAFLGSLFLMLLAAGLALLSMLLLPLRLLLRLFRKRPTGGSAEKVVILGFDGMDYGTATNLIARGKLPNLNALSQTGCFTPLQTTCPPISPVAWASFLTGVNPGKHNIFDFLSRNPKTYAPELSSTSIRSHGSGKPEIKLLRKSRPFWALLGEHGIMNSALRVPMTFPPEKNRGLLLSGLSVPDLRGSQGSFTVFQSEKPDKEYTGGVCVHVTPAKGKIRTRLEGPESGNRTLSIPLKIQIKKNDKAVLKIPGHRPIKLIKGVYTDWIRLRFRQGARKIYGICRFVLLSTSPQFKLYATPLNIDPERPAMPISHPPYYSLYLSRLVGPFATLGLAEDTWAFNEGVIDERLFLKQTYDIQQEREQLFLESSKRIRKGFCVTVFDLLDRVQHCFYDCSEKEPEQPSSQIEEAYIHLDNLVGKVMQNTGKNDFVAVMSDHGFTAFKTGVNINAWLKQKGYLKEEEDESDGNYFSKVNWSQTKAYAAGLAGIYLNLKGRESRGIVSDEKRPVLKREIENALKSLEDPETGQRVVREIYDSDAAYTGPYSSNAPDLIVGFEKNYRVSWGCATGNTSGPVFEKNVKQWSGDHCMDRDVVPGVFFCNRRLKEKELRPHIQDIAPTVLNLFGINPPSYMDGKTIEFE